MTTEEIQTVMRRIQSQLKEVSDMMPHHDDLIEMAESMRNLDMTNPDDVQRTADNASALLEQVAIAIMPNGHERDILLEGRTDLGQPAVTITPVSEV